MYISLKRIYFTFFISILMQVSSASAAPLTIEWDVQVDSKYDFAAGVYVPFTPFNAFASTTFDNIVTSTVDHGASTITYFDGLYGTAWVSPMSNQIGSDPFGGGLAAPHRSYTYADTTDFPSLFHEEAVSTANVTNLSSDGTQFWVYDLVIRAERRGPGRGGQGLDDYPFTPTSLVEFYNDFQSSGTEAYFRESYSLVDNITGASLDGFSWGGTATISQIIQAPSEVPIPAAAFMLAPALLGFMGLRRRAKNTVV